MEITATTQDLQEKMLEMMIYFESFCKEHGLMYYIAGGGLIGVVRHHGFIPWDDDIDLFMPRSDYERLAQLWEEYGDKSKYAYCRTDREHNYHNNAASIRDIHTTEINFHSVNEDICHGIALEIIPLDGCPKSKIKRAYQLWQAIRFRLFNAQRLPDNKGKLIRAVSSVLFKIVRSEETRYRIWTKAEKNMTQFKWEDCDEITELLGSIKGMLLRHDKKDFDSVEYKEFAGYQFPVMAGYEKYLRRIWGDYMKLPPEEDRVAKHNLVYLSTTEPYSQFKGILYCVKGK